MPVSHMMVTTVASRPSFLPSSMLFTMFPPVEVSREDGFLGREPAAHSYRFFCRYCIDLVC